LLIKYSLVIPEELSDRRLDQALAILLPEHSRSRLTQWIKQGFVLVNMQQALRPRDPVQEGQSITICAQVEEHTTWEAQNIPLNIVYEDDALLVINKPVGLIVHPAAGVFEGTMVNGLLYHDPKLAALPRAGIVHRLDKDTTGLLVVAKTLASHTYLVNELQDRRFLRQYECLVNGVVTAGGTVTAPIGRHPLHRTEMAVVGSGKHAVTHYRLIKKFSAHTHLRVELETGRTHQIRVHLAHINFPIVGDPVYGGRARLPKGASLEIITALQNFKRQALHARRLGLMHPVTGEQIQWEAPLPEDFQNLINILD